MISEPCPDCKGLCCRHAYGYRDTHLGTHHCKSCVDGTKYTPPNVITLSPAEREALQLEMYSATRGEWLMGDEPRVKHDRFDADEKELYSHGYYRPTREATAIVEELRGLQEKQFEFMRLRAAAHAKVKRDLTRDTCEWCGQVYSGNDRRKIHAHHHNGYSEAHQTDVVYVCAKCHSQDHHKRDVDGYSAISKRISKLKRELVRYGDMWSGWSVHRRGSERIVGFGSCVRIIDVDTLKYGAVNGFGNEKAAQLMLIFDLERKIFRIRDQIGLDQKELAQAEKLLQGALTQLKEGP